MRVEFGRPSAHGSYFRGLPDDGRMNLMDVVATGTAEVVAKLDGRLPLPDVIDYRFRHLNRRYAQYGDGQVDINPRLLNELVATGGLAVQGLLAHELSHASGDVKGVPANNGDTLSISIGEGNACKVQDAVDGGALEGILSIGEPLSTDEAVVVYNHLLRIDSDVRTRQMGEMPIRPDAEIDYYRAGVAIVSGAMDHLGAPDIFAVHTQPAATIRNHARLHFKAALPIE